MATVTDGINNPFVVDGTSTPVAKSAFAQLNVERTELVAGKTVDDLLARALKILRRDPDLATCYGRPVSDTDLNRAAEALREPKSRLLSDLLDYRHHHFDLTDLPELAAAVESFRQRLSQVERPDIVELALIGQLLQDIVGEIPAPDPGPLTAQMVELPAIDQLLADLA